MAFAPLVARAKMARIRGLVISFAMGTTLPADRMKRLIRLFLAVIAALCAVAAQPALAAGKKVALIIGNSNYVNGGSLPNPQNDARLVAQTARNAGFEVTQVSDLAVATFHQALIDFRNKADTAEVAMIYYAGHGIEDSSENWLIPTDVVLADPRDLRFQAVPLTEVLDAVTRAKLKIILLDACRNNPFKDKWTSGTRSFQTGLRKIDVDPTNLVIFAADQGSAIVDGQEGGNSYFAQSLAKRLAEPGLALQSLPSRVNADVTELSGGRQRPLSSGLIPGMDYFLVQKGG